MDKALTKSPGVTTGPVPALVMPEPCWNGEVERCGDEYGVSDKISTAGVEKWPTRCHQDYQHFLPHQAPSFFHLAEILSQVSIAHS